MTKVLEGTWAEIRAQQPDWEHKRLRVEVLGASETQNGAAAPTNDEDFSLAERLRGRMGRVAFEPTEGIEPPDAPPKLGEPTLYDEMKDLVGTVSFGPTDLAERSEEYFAQAMDEKYPRGQE